MEHKKDIENGKKRLTAFEVIYLSSHGSTPSRKSDRYYKLLDKVYEMQREESK